MDFVLKVSNLPRLCYKIQIMYTGSDGNLHLMGIDDTTKRNTFPLPCECLRKKIIILGNAVKEGSALDMGDSADQNGRE